jgi:hypothetical protein
MEPQARPRAQPPPGKLQEAGQSSSFSTRLPGALRVLANVEVAYIAIDPDHADHLTDHLPVRPA